MEGIIIDFVIVFDYGAITKNRRIYPPWYKQTMFEWTIEYLAGENILYLKSRGIMDSSSANVMVKALADTAVEYKCLTHLVDHSETTFALSFLEYFNRPAINQRLGVSRSFKTAMVFAQLTRDTMFMETVFRNRGYNLRHFTDIDEARVWLIQK